MSQSSTPYDDVFRTILYDCRELFPPLLNEIFSESYIGTEAIYFGKNEHLMNRQRGEGEKRITDSSFTVDSVLIIRYHLECQSSGDASIDRRMFEYDSQIALEDSEEKEDGLYLPFPKSAVLFLRRTAHTTEKMQIYIEQNGREFCMEIPIVHIIDYTMEELFNFFGRNFLSCCHSICFAMRAFFQKWKKMREKGRPCEMPFAICADSWKS